MFARRKLGFTVVELLVVIAIIGVLVALLMPAVQMARESARRTQCTSNLRQCGMAITGYASAKGHLPPARSIYKIGGTDKVLNWVVPVLAELEQTALLSEIRSGTLPQPTRIPILLCPSQPRYGSLSPPTGIASDYPLSYVVNGGRANRNSNNFDWIENGVFVDKARSPHVGTDKHRLDEIAKYDGTSTTLMLSENPSVPSWLEAPQVAAMTGTMGQQFAEMLWFPDDPATPPPLFIGLNQDVGATPTYLAGNLRYARPASFHPGGFNVVMCDNSVQFMSETTPYRVYAVLMTSRGERANDPAGTTFTTTNPPWQSPTDSNYPGVSF